MTGWPAAAALARVLAWLISMVSAISSSQAQFTAAKPSEARAIGSTRDGVHGGSNVITMSTEPMPGTRAAAFATPSFRKRMAGHAGVVAVMVMRTAPATTE